MKRILVVDANEAFATLLQQELEGMEMRADVVASGHEALRATAAADYAMAIVDMGLPDLPASQLVRALRQEHPDLRLMVIPLEGEEIPAELADTSIQGTLPKPFFLPELPERIRQALSRPLTAQGQRETEAAPLRAPAGEAAPDVLPLMSRLAQEVGAEAVLLIRGGELVAHTGRMSENGVSALTSLVADAWRASTRVAQILGKEQLRFEQSIEGAEYLLYSLAITEDLILSVVVAGKVPLGMIRHRAKETAEEIRRMWKG
ncbi:MAG: response regulator [Thermoflexales bacterium]|nr:response regulator [Thermoflexales bacterium]